MIYTLLHPYPRHPLLRALFAFIGILFLASLVVFGFFAAIVLVALGSLIWLIRQFIRPTAPQTASTTPPPQPPGVIEGEFVVLHDGDTHRGDS